MKTIEIISGGRKAQFTTKSVTFDGKEFFYAQMSDVANNVAEDCYSFTYDGQTRIFNYESKDAKTLNAIFSQVQNLQATKPAPVPGTLTQAPKPAAHFDPKPSKEASSNVPPVVSRSPKEQSATQAATPIPVAVQQGIPVPTATPITEVTATPIPPTSAATPKPATEPAPIHTVSQVMAAAQAPTPEISQANPNMQAGENKISPEAKSPEDSLNTTNTASEPVKSVDKNHLKADKQAEKAKLKAEKARLRAEKQAAKDKLKAEKHAAKDKKLAEKQGIKTTESVSAASSENTAAATGTIAEITPSVSEEKSTSPKPEKKPMDFEKKAKMKKSFMVFGIILAVIIVLSVIYFFVFGTSDNPNLGPNSTESQQYNDIDELIKDLE